MKIEKEKAFRKITITLENEDEVEALYQVGNYSDKIAIDVLQKEEFKDILKELWDGLK